MGLCASKGLAESDLSEITPSRPRLQSVDCNSEHDQTLRKVRFFSALDDDQLAVLRKEFGVSRYQAGAEIVTQGTAGREYFVIHSGSVSILAADSKVEVAVLSSPECPL